VREWREASSSRGVIVVNTSYQIAPWADALFAIDRNWWQYHDGTINESFRGKRYKLIDVGGAPGNSGAGAILLADKLGAKRIILIGYDCHKRGGSHWHGDHPRPLGNAGSIGRWPRQFRAVAEKVKADVVNCSPGTMLDCFPKADLSEALCL
jgi:hypothetical protein